MKLIEKEHLYQVPFKEYNNVYQLLPKWKEAGRITNKEMQDFQAMLQTLNVKHHNEADFNQRISELATLQGVKNSIDRQHVGGELFGFEYDGVKIFTESVEFGVIMLVNNKEISVDNFHTLSFLMMWIDRAIDNPQKAHIEMNYFHMQKTLPLAEDYRKVIKI